VKQPKYRRLTPLKAFELLRKLDKTEHARLYAPGWSEAKEAVSEVRAALADHVRAAIVRGSR
jgi:hypothetical protein